jgi:hypothetical protein
VGAGAPAAAAPVPDGRPRITGRVLDGLGRPVAGAEVRTAPDNPRRALAPGPAAAVTGPDGRFAVPLAGGAPFFTLLVDAPRFAPAWQAAARPGSDVTITLERPGTLAGTARDRDGRPLGGARLRWLGLRGTTRFERETVAAADGTWRFDDLPALRDRRGRPWWLEARADGLAPLFLETLPSDPPPESPLDLVLVEGATVEGRVEDAETGAPVGGARVWLASHEGVPGLFRGDGLFLPNPHVPRRLQETRAAADGSFRFVHVPARGLHAPSAPGGAAFSLSAVAPGAAFASMEVPLLPDGAVWEARLRSAPAGAVRGRVLDGDGRPVPGAEVTAGPEPLEDRLHEPGSPFPRWWAQADADGRYRIPAVPASRTRAHAFEVRARLPGGLASAAALVAPLAGAEVEAPDLVVLPDPGATVLVTDRDGRPVWGAMPSLQIVDPRVLEQRTGPDGRMRVRLPRDAAAAGPIRLRFRASGHATMLTPPLHLTEASAGETRVTLGPPCPVSGRVVRAEGGPAAGAVVHAALSWLSLDEVLAHAARALEPDAGTSGIVASTSTDDEGRFSLDDLPAGPHRLVAVEGGRAATVVAAAPAAGASLVLPPSPAAPATGVVEGSVRDASGGRAPVDFEVVLTAGARRIVARPAAPGRFRIEGVAAGSWRLTLAAPGFVPRVEEGLAVRAEAPAVLELALERGAVVTGRVAVPDGVEPAGVELVFAPERGGPPPRVALDGSGRFRLAGFAPGRYRARVEAGPGRPPLAPAGSGVLVVPASAPAVACDLELVIGAAGSSR